jgi:hypothetical protein
MVVAAPTASGKTTIHELGIVRLLSTRDLKQIKFVFFSCSFTVTGSLAKSLQVRHDCSQ